VLDLDRQGGLDVELLGEGGGDQFFRPFLIAARTANIFGLAVTGRGA
jgi:hypothetical protein